MGWIPVTYMCTVESPLLLHRSMPSGGCQAVKRCSRGRVLFSLQIMQGWRYRRNYGGVIPPREPWKGLSSHVTIQPWIRTPYMWPLTSGTCFKSALEYVEWFENPKFDKTIKKYARRKGKKKKKKKKKHCSAREEWPSLNPHYLVDRFGFVLSTGPRVLD